ncbi:nucleotidyltransferase family protein [Pedobacter jamesrossensis]|uniref:Nucleotidyltransferase family protein n=1 Tax=Pedobacter jamesrossensis TaxID=1908238 RepID=A0ABV8NMU8_9SPHI
MDIQIQNKQALFSKLLGNASKIKSFGVNKLGVFGSFVNGTPKKNSDVDLLVEFEASKKSYDSYIDLCSYLEDLLGRRVELVTPPNR